MSTQTVDLPATWMRSGTILAQQNYLSIGWHTSYDPYYPLNPYGVKRNGWVKFDTSQLNNLYEWQVVSAVLKLKQPYTPNRPVTVGIYRVIQNATNDVGWFKYDSTNYWSMAGGEGSGTDHVSTALATYTFDDIVDNEIQISRDGILDIHTSNRPIFFKTTSSYPNVNAYIQFDILSDIFIRVTYRLPSLTGDATIF